MSLANIMRHRAPFVADWICTNWQTVSKIATQTIRDTYIKYIWFTPRNINNESLFACLVTSTRIDHFVTGCLWRWMKFSVNTKGIKEIHSSEELLGHNTKIWTMNTQHQWRQNNNTIKWQDRSAKSSVHSFLLKFRHRRWLGNSRWQDCSTACGRNWNRTIADCCTFHPKLNSAVITDRRCRLKIT